MGFFKEFGVTGAEAVDREVSPEEQERIKSKYGFKSCASVRIQISLNSGEMCQAIHGLGFNYSKDGKNIPSWVYTVGEELKCAYLRGFFSADGNNASLLTPQITITSDRMRDQTRFLLLSTGIRTSLSEGKTKNSFIGSKRKCVKAKSYLKVKDRKEFFEKIGFLQPHKQPRNPKGTNKDWGTSSSIAKQTILKYLKLVKDKTKLPREGTTIMLV